MSKTYKTFLEWLDDQPEAVQKRMETVSGALAWDQALQHSEHVKQLEASHRIKMENQHRPAPDPVNAQLLDVVKELKECSRYWSEYDVPIGIFDRIDAAIAAAEQQPPASEPERILSDTRCQCCGYMTYHREHMNCIRAAKPLAVPDGYALVPIDLLKSVIADNNSWHAMGYDEPDEYGAHAVDLANMLAAAKGGEV